MMVVPIVLGAMEVQFELCVSCVCVGWCWTMFLRCSQWERCNGACWVCRAASGFGKCCCCSIVNCLFYSLQTQPTNHCTELASPSHTPCTHPSPKMHLSSCAGLTSTRVYRKAHIHRAASVSHYRGYNEQTHLRVLGREPQCGYMTCTRAHNPCAQNVTQTTPWT